MLEIVSSKEVDPNFKKQIFSEIYREFPAKYNTEKWLSIQSQGKSYRNNRKNEKYE